MSTQTINIRGFSENVSSYSNYCTYYNKETAIEILSKTSVLNELSCGNEVILSTEEPPSVLAVSRRPNYFSDAARVGSSFAYCIFSIIEEKIGEGFIEKLTFSNSSAQYGLKKYKNMYLLKKKKAEIKNSIPDWDLPKQMCIPRVGAQYKVNTNWELTLYNYNSPNKNLIGLIFPMKDCDQRSVVGFNGVQVLRGDPIGQLIIPEGTLFSVTRINLYDIYDSRKSHVIITIENGQRLEYDYVDYFTRKLVKVLVALDDFNRLDSSINLISIQ